jgi:hypothetical protein
MDRPRICLNMVEIISSFFNRHGILGEIVHTTDVPGLLPVT